VHRAAAAGARLWGRVDHHLMARQMRRQCAVVACGAAGTALRLCAVGIGRVCLRLVLGDRLFQILKPELQLLVG